MSIEKFKKMITRAGEIHFFRNNKKVAPEELPVEAHLQLAGEESKEVEIDLDAITTEEPEKTEDAQEEIVSGIHVEVEELKPADKVNKVSYLSGEPATRTRWLNGVEYNLTEDEYQSLNLGKLAQRVREKDAEIASQE